jgi:hypothetical protein
MRTISVSDFNRPLNKVVTHHADGDNSDIINTIHLSLPEATKQVKAIAPKFIGANDLETAKNIFDFLIKNVSYKMDGYHQKIKMPNRLIADGTGDCKSFSLFAAAVLNSLNIPFKFRYTAYDGTNVPQHVYTILVSGTDEIIIDPVYKKFNKEAKYTYKKDYDMRISTIHGLPSTTSSQFHPIGRTNPLAIVPFAAGRGAFLLLVKFNVRALATNLDRARRLDYQKIANKWELLGGNWEQLDKTIVEGSKKKMIFGVPGIGTGIVEITAALAAAAPIIAAISPIIKDILRNLEVTKNNANPADVEVQLPQQPSTATSALPLAALASLFLFK